MEQATVLARMTREIASDGIKMAAVVLNGAVPTPADELCHVVALLPQPLTPARLPMNCVMELCGSMSICDVEVEECQISSLSASGWQDNMVPTNLTILQGAYARVSGNSLIDIKMNQCTPQHTRTKSTRYTRCGRLVDAGWQPR